MKRLAAILVVLVSGTTIARSEGDWKQVDEDGSLRVEARPMPGTKLREILVHARSPLPPSELFAILWNVGEQHEFVPNVKELKVLAQGEDSATIYERVKIPVVQDRDYVLKLTKKIDEARGVYEVHAEGQRDGPQPQKGVVRMTHLSSTFTLRPAPGGGTTLEYLSFGDPAGDVPAWILRAADVRGPKDFVRAILKRAQQKHHN